jgi:predicted metal-dependent hydrolase
MRRDIELDLGGRAVRAELRESPRARRLRLVVRAGRPLEITVPRGTRNRTLNRFLESNAGWIRDRLEEAREREARMNRLGLERPGAVVLAGRHVPVIRSDHPGRSTAALREGRLIVSGPDPGAAVERWYRRQARSLLEASAEREGRRLGLRYARIAVRDQRTRWGSCSTRGTLSFNWRLSLVPPAVLDYVVVHELLHLREHNHSRRFWGLLDEHRPGWRQQANWLREHAEELQAFDPADRSDWTIAR